MIVSNEIFAEQMDAIDQAIASMNSFMQEQAAEYERLFEPMLVENAVLTEGAIAEFAKRVVTWLREFAAKVAAFAKRVWAFMTGKVEPSIEAAKAMAADPKFFRQPDKELYSASERSSVEKGMTCIELLSRPGFVHPTVTSPRLLHLCPGTTLAAKAVSDMEKAFITLADEQIKAEIRRVQGGLNLNFGPKAEQKFMEAEQHILAMTKSHGGYDANVVMQLGFPAWYLGPEVEAKITSIWFTGAIKKMQLIERDAADLGKLRPGDAIAGHLDKMLRTLADARMKMHKDGRQLAIDNLRRQGNHVVQFHNGLLTGALSGYRQMAVFVMTCLRSVADKSRDIEGTAVRRKEVPAIPYMESSQYLTEGLAGFIKNLATGDIEEEIDELEKEAADIHTPEQQRFVLTKIVRLLERLVILRHNPGKLQQFVHDRVSWFERVLGSKQGSNAGKEMTVRVGEQIARLSRLRDKVLAKKWSDPKWNERVQELRDKAEDILKKASSADAAFE